VNTDRITIVRRDAAATAVAAHIVAAGRAAFARSGRFTVAVSAAALDESLVETLAAAPISDERFWRVTRLFLADTWLPGSLALWRHLRAAALRLPLAPGAEHFDALCCVSAVAAANAFEQELRATFSLTAGELPRFDLCLLALGANGQIGGLAPGSCAHDEIGRLVVADFVPALGRAVVTLTPPVIQNALTIVALAAAPEHIACAHLAPGPRPCVAGPACT
jgi:6-phosphogluconolactonase/glucosamine-6-phosphate isomerase/deaminase